MTDRNPAITQWALNWDRGSLTVYSQGATMLPRFDLDDGRSVSPLATPPWAEERVAENIVPTIAFMRGEWVCVPFGAAGPLMQVAPRWRGVSDEIPDGPLHGAPADGPWSLTDRGRDFLTLRFDCEPEHPIAWVERRISAEPGEAAVTCGLRIMPRRDVALPIGLHPVLRVPRTPLQLRLRPGPFRFGITPPYLMAEDGSIAGLDRTFTDLGSVPHERGGSVDLTRVPFAGHYEDAVQLVAASGRFAADNLEEGYTFVVEWERDALPSCIIWYSNEGLSDPPWNRRHRALGIEPVCSALGLGIKASEKPNPLNAEGERTAVAFTKGKLWETSYRLLVDHFKGRT